ncbi:hypothetical protein N5P37_005636 [Trichoderma harzianum]|nr:hypothetical protein N5P37_005636 [Trichoderma harzianum]
MERQPTRRKLDASASPSQSDSSSTVVATVVRQAAEGLPHRIEQWMKEATSISRLLKSISSSQKQTVLLRFELWLREQKEDGVPALCTGLLQSITTAEINVGQHSRLEEKAQYSEKSKKQSSKAPEAKSSFSQEAVNAYVVKAVDKPLDESALTEASGEMPEVRLVIDSLYIHARDLGTQKRSIRFPSQEPRFENIFGVVQDAVDFIIKFNLRFGAHSKPFLFQCDIIYSPVSNDCYLQNRSASSIYLISSNKLLPEKEISCGKHTTFCSGAWRISIKSDDIQRAYPIFDILVRDESFSISADNDNNDDNNGKVLTVSGTNLFTKGPREIQPMQTTFRKTRASILGLADGGTVHVKDLHDEKRTYDLKRVRGISKGGHSIIISCEHSRWPGIKLVAKVPRFDTKWSTHKEVKREMELLAQLTHPNIVLFYGADPRIHAIYLEELPPTLEKNLDIGFSWDNATVVLFDISSALEYLTKKRVIHCDVKPSNIAFSHERGAILCDFNLGGRLEPENKGLGGSFHFFPPETIQPGKVRGFPGDVWALGVTILVIMKLYQQGPVFGEYNIKDVHRPLTPTYIEIAAHVRDIANERSTLNLEDEIQYLIYQMLELDSEKRVTAEGIQRKLRGNQLAKKRKRDSSS